MSQTTHLAFAAESGDAGMDRINPTFPLLSFATCVFEAGAYEQFVVPSIAELKERYFAGRKIVLHERDIRRNTGDFALLRGLAQRSAFEADLIDLIDATPFIIIAAVVHKTRLQVRYPRPDDPYALCLRFAFERLRWHLNAVSGPDHVARIMAESRNPVADRELRRAFDKFKRGDYLGTKIENVALEFATKKDGHAGMEIADLVANPIARHVLDLPEALIPFGVIESKFRRNYRGQADGWGLKIFP